MAFSVARPVRSWLAATSRTFIHYTKSLSYNIDYIMFGSISELNELSQLLLALFTS